MDWKAKVELFEQFRRGHEFGIGTVAGVATKFGVHRRHSGGGPSGTAQATAHIAAGLSADPDEVSWHVGRGIDGAQPCT
jgi:hypothetical protein